jgi:hypothetical protein
MALKEDLSSSRKICGKTNKNRAVNHSEILPYEFSII